MGYASCITASIACRITSVIKDVCSDILLIATDSAFIPVTILIILLIIIVGYASHITASIAGCVACVIKDMRCYVFLIMAYRTLEPMVSFIILPLIFKIM